MWSGLRGCSSRRAPYDHDRQRCPGCHRSGKIGFPGSAIRPTSFAEGRCRISRRFRVELRRQDADPRDVAAGPRHAPRKATPAKSFADAHGGDGRGGVPEHAEAERLRAHEHASFGIRAALLARADEVIE